MWYDFRSSYTYCSRCGVLLEDFIESQGERFCCEECMENYVRAHSIRYPYGVLYGDEIYNTMEQVLDIWRNNAKYFDY